MSEPVVQLRPQARIDLAGCYAYIGERNSEAARRFLLAAEATLAALARLPGTGASFEVENPRLAGLRCGRVKRFKNYLIFYLPIAGGIDVIRVLHGARNLRDILEAEDAD